MIFRINLRYLVLAVLLFVIEVIIAIYITDRFIRPYGEDFLVVVLVYCTIKGFLQISVFKAAITAFSIAFLVETFQYFHLVETLGLEDSRLAQVVLGTSFEWTDIIAYCLGILMVMIVENRILNTRKK